MRARSGVTWAQLAREAQREYASQGWAGFPDEPADPAEIGCVRFTQIAARVPYGARTTGRDAMLEGALVRAPGRLPRGAEFQLTPDRFDVAPGRELAMTVRARAPRSLGAASVRIMLPPGWRGDEFARLGRLVRDRDATATLRVTAPSDAPPGRVRIPATLRAGGRSGTSSALVRVVPAVQGTLHPLPQVADFRSWVTRAGAPQLDGLVHPIASLGSGETRDIQIDLRNFAARAESGTVALRLPPGFSADAASKSFEPIAPEGAGSVTFRVTNTDSSLKTSNEGGDYEFEIVTMAGGAASSERAALNLVPVTAVPRASNAPLVDGVESPGEYGGPVLDLSRLWEGEPPSGPSDASGDARAVWAGDALYFVVNVRDDVLGTVLPASDAKRHWRTDSVELAIDPRGDSENTSTTFKVGVFPTTLQGGPVGYRDADNKQGPVAETAPGFVVASKVSSPYAGYTLEMKVPFADLPAAVRPGRFGLNIFIYDSDTQDKTGQTRLGWSTWGGVQGDPYRWGRASVDGYAPPPDLPTEPREPVFPREAALSIDSPQSITQAARDGVALAGGPQAADRVRIVGRPRLLSADTLLVRLRTQAPGVAHVHATDADGHGLGAATIPVARAGRLAVAVPVSDVDALHAAAVAFAPHSGGTDSVSVPIRD